MSFDAGSITGKLGLDISEFGEGMLQAQSVASLFPAVVADFMVNPLLAVVEAAKEAARAVFEAVSGVGNAAQELGIQAAKAGVSVGYFSRMSEVAKTVNVSAEQLGTAFKFLEKNAVDAVGGNKVAEKSFGDLGISVEFLRDHLNDTEAIFERVHSAINGLATPAEATRRAMEVMGRQGGDIVPLFKLGRDEIQAMGDTAQRWARSSTRSRSSEARATSGWRSRSGRRSRGSGVPWPSRSYKCWPTTWAKSCPSSSSSPRRSARPSSGASTSSRRRTARRRSRGSRSWA